MICSSPLALAPAPSTWRPAPRAESGSGRGTRTLTIRPKYGDQACNVEVHYLCCGAPGAPTVIVQGGISATRNVVAQDGDAVPGWWQSLVGDGRAVDLERYRVLSIDWVTPQELGASSVSSEDQADLLAALLLELGIGRAHCFVGSSYGAMVGLALAARHALAVDRLVLLAGAHRAHPLATAQRAIQRDIVRLGRACGRVDEALGLARQLAMTTYRGSEEFARRFGGAPVYHDDRFHFPVEDYLQHQGRQFVERFDPERFLALSESIDLHDVAPERVTATATLVGFSSDRLVPLADMCELQRRLCGPATLTVIDSPYGHDGFLKETEQLAPLLREAVA
ncbi:MAG: homoserine O-succinyltransferase [Xanthomonadales bacterium]|nr:homoserine O-succinyltransferase [Xanthomonadales bacterium]